MFFNKGFVSQLRDKAIKVNKTSKKTIVFPEVDEKIIEACSIIIKKGIATPLIIGTEKEVEKIANRLKISNIEPRHILDHTGEKNKEKFEEYAKKYLELRTKDGKSVTAEDAKAKMSMPHYYGAMLVHDDKAEGMICGINSATKPYYPAFEIIKTKEGISRASGIFIMTDPSEKNVYFFADCVLNINPTSEQLAEIAITSAETAINFGIKPQIAMLSFSTRDSAKHEMVDKVKNAVKLFKEKDHEMIVDGEIQLDAALVPEVAQKKCPDSPLQGRANVLIFPDLNSANIGYKLVQRLGNYKAIGPIMQGLQKPVNDLSRGCSVQDIVDLTAITVVQGL